MTFLYLLEFYPQHDKEYQVRIEAICQTLQKTLEFLPEQTKEQAQKLIEHLLRRSEIIGGTANQTLCTCLQALFPLFDVNEDAVEIFLGTRKKALVQNKISHIKKMVSKKWLQ